MVGRLHTVAAGLVRFQSEYAFLALVSPGNAMSSQWVGRTFFIAISSPDVAVPWLSLG